MAESRRLEERRQVSEEAPKPGARAPPHTTRGLRSVVQHKATRRGLLAGAVALPLLNACAPGQPSAPAATGGGGGAPSGGTPSAATAKSLSPVKTAEQIAMAFTGRR